MFQMVVSDVFEIRNIFTVYGECNGFEKLKPGKIKDETGKEYNFYIPLGTFLDIENDTSIELQLIAPDIDLDALKGQKLIQV